jgi:hypothetical protein
MLITINDNNKNADNKEKIRIKLEIFSVSERRNDPSLCDRLFRYKVEKMAATEMKWKLGILNRYYAHLLKVRKSRNIVFVLKCRGHNLLNA